MEKPLVGLCLLPASHSPQPKIRSNCKHVIQGVYGFFFSELLQITLNAIQYQISDVIVHGIFINNCCIFIIIRNKAFVHIMKSLEKMTDRPQFIFLENVKGFCHSETHVQWTETLTRCGYSWRQYLLTPFHFRVPNNRMRFYMVIKRDSDSGLAAPGPTSNSKKEVDKAEHIGEVKDDGYSKDISIVYNDIRPCLCASIRSSTINGKSLNSSFLHLDSSMLHKLHEMGEDDITGPPGVNDISQYLVPTEDIGMLALISSNLVLDSFNEMGSGASTVLCIFCLLYCTEHQLPCVFLSVTLPCIVIFLVRIVIYVLRYTAW